MITKFSTDKLYYDTAAGNRGAQATYCGHHPIMLERYPEHVVELDDSEIITTEDGEIVSIMSCELCTKSSDPWSGTILFSTFTNQM
jgi:hypothetical protein